MYFDKYYSEIAIPDSILVHTHLEPIQVETKVRAARQYNSQQHWIDHLHRTGYLSRTTESYQQKIPTGSTLDLLKNARAAYKKGNTGFPLLLDECQYTFKGGFNYKSLVQLSMPFQTLVEPILAK